MQPNIFLNPIITFKKIYKKYGIALSFGQGCMQRTKLINPQEGKNGEY